VGAHRGTPGIEKFVEAVWRGEKAESAVKKSQ